MIVAVIALGERVPSRKTAVDVPWYAWSGGVFGAAFILLAILLLPSLGAATLFALVIAGQVLAAVTLDHFGAFGLTPHPVSAARLAGAALLIAGVVLIRDRSSGVSEAQIRHHVAALVLDRVGTAEPLERFLRILIAKGGGPLIVGFGGVGILWSTASFLRECAHPLQRTGMILRRRLLEQRAGRSVVPGPAIAFGQHHAELVLRLGIGLGGLRQQFARTRRIG